MLKNHDATATIAVRDLAVAKRFYAGPLGLEPSGPENPEVLV